MFPVKPFAVGLDTIDCGHKRGRERLKATLSEQAQHACLEFEEDSLGGTVSCFLG
ncbi:MAG TPA: hypothetical protein PKN86_10935 [Candidatus Obscuribacter sp.]|nr:hypothetical protein [Candidatus Obscuribacter sp.]HNB14858.1 hypothetical protein [Candidatus Obscuribacter sp.]HND06165.1 hypothetical protein [Candidatus Obscuribacter sp.]HNG19018.1 hypothetical protein [Candidatus Obscuribacter sp.]HNG77121.1 hypothetical protein [Candidatus Obscuribacter sp.]